MSYLDIAKRTNTCTVKKSKYKIGTACVCIKQNLQKLNEVKKRVWEQGSGESRKKASL